MEASLFFRLFVKQLFLLSKRGVNETVLYGFK